MFPFAKAKMHELLWSYWSPTAHPKDLAGHRGARVPGSGDPKQTRFSHLPLTKAKGREISGGETRRNLFQ